MNDITLIILTYVFSSLALIVSCYSIYRSYQIAKVLKRLRERGGR